jgi:hypothetical protein
VKHAQTYQLMPWCLARISEPTGPKTFFLKHVTSERFR